MQRPVVTIISLLALTLCACSNVAQPILPVVSTATLSPIPTFIATVAPTATPLLSTSTPDAIAGPNPQGQPASEWKGIPIMPGAIAGEGDEEGYVFTIKATPQQIQEYYQLELGKLGWQPMATGDGNSSTMLIFTNNASATLSVSILT